MHAPISRGEKRRPRLLGLWPAAGLCIALLLGGCAEHHVVTVDKGNFEQEVLKSDRPVLVDFDKDGCPICIPTTVVMQQLSRDYLGRVKVANFKIMTAYWTFPAWRLKQHYGIYYVPTTILFDKGVEVKRWNMGYFAEPYRRELDRLLESRSATTSADRGSR